MCNLIFEKCPNGLEQAFFFFLTFCISALATALSDVFRVPPLDVAGDVVVASAFPALLAFLAFPPHFSQFFLAEELSFFDGDRGYSPRLLEAEVGMLTEMGFFFRSLFGVFDVMILRGVRLRLLSPSED